MLKPRQSRAERGFAIAPILYLLGLIGVGAGIFFSGYSQMFRSTQTLQNTVAAKSDLQANATTLAATSWLSNDKTVLCPPLVGSNSPQTPSANCSTNGSAITVGTSFANASAANLPANYASVSSAGSPVEVGVFKAGSGAKVLDPWGHYYLYCRWESGIGASPAIAIISGGANGKIETTCGSTTPGGDDLMVVWSTAVTQNRAAVWQTTTAGSSVTGAQFGATGSQVSIGTNGNVTIPGTLGVTGATALNGGLTATDITNTPINGSTGSFTTLAVGGSGQMTVDGSGNIATGAALQIGGLSTLGQVSAGSSTLSYATVTNNASVGGTLGVTGATTLGSTSVTDFTTTDASNSASFAGGLNTATGKIQIGTSVVATGSSSPLLTVGKGTGSPTVYPFMVDQYGNVTGSNFSGAFNGNLTGSQSGGSVSATSLAASGNTILSGTLQTGAINGTSAVFSGTVTATGGFIGTMALGGGGVTLSGIVPLTNGGTGINASSDANLLSTLFTGAGAMSGMIPAADVACCINSSQLSNTGGQGTWSTVYVGADGRVTGGTLSASSANSITDGNGDTVSVGTASGIIFTVGSGTSTVGNWTTTGLMIGSSKAAVNKLDVYGAQAIGTGYAGVNTAPTNGLIVQGNVGIGTSNPLGNALDVNGTVVATNFSGSGAGLTSIGTSAISGVIPIVNGGTNASTQTTNGVAYYNGTAITTGTSFVLSGGNVGIGTTSPGDQLEINGNALLGYGYGLQARISGGGYTAGTSGFFPNINVIGGRLNDTVIRYGAGTNYLVIQHGTSNVLVADNSGNVGIGTTSPQSKLHIQAGEVQVGSSGASCAGNNGGAVRFSGSTLYFCDGGTWQSIYGSGGSGGSISGAGSTGYDAIWTSPTAIGTGLIYESGGKVGIGTTSPGTLLDVYASNASPSIMLENASSTLAQYPAVNVVNYGGSTPGFPQVNVAASRGSKASSSPIQSGDYLGSIQAYGVQDTANTWGWSANINFIADDNFSSSARGSHIAFSTTTPGTTSGGERMRIAGNGNVGIGTTNPGFLLDINGTSSGTTNMVVGNTTPIYLISNDAGIGFNEYWDSSGSTSRYGRNSSSAYAAQISMNATAGALQFSTAAATGNAGAAATLTERMRITPGGLVGIGTTSPQFALHVNGSALFGDGSSTSSPLIRANSAYSSAAGPDFTYIGDSTTGLFHPAASVLAFSYNGNEAMRINSSGYLGIGTTSPGFALDVWSGAAYPFNAMLNNNSTGYNVLGSFKNGNNAGGSNYTRLFVGQNAYNNMFIETADQSNVKGNTLIQPWGGNVGIGSTSPVNLLDLAGSGGVHINSGVPGNTSMALYNNSGTLTWNGSALATGASVSGTTNYIPVFTGSNSLGNSVMYQSSGNVGIGTTGPVYPLEIYNSANTGSSAEIATPGTGTAQQANIDFVTKDNGVALGGSAGNKGWSVLARGNAYTGDANNFEIWNWNGTSWTNAITALPSGNVGIGTTSPIANFDVRPTANTNFIIWNSSTLGSNTLEIQNDNDANTAVNPMEFEASKYNFAQGNVGIGMTNPGDKLDVYSTGGANAKAINAIDSGGNSVYLIPILGNGGYNPLAQAGDMGLIFAGSGGQNTGNLVIGNWSSSATGIRIQANGNVGIGTTSPQYPLAVNGSFVNYNGSVISMVAPCSACNASLFGNISNTDMTLYTNNMERVRIQAGGNVGIGTTGPGQILDVENSGTSNGIKVGNSGGNYLQLFDDGNAHIEGNGSGYFWINGNVNQVLDINHGGGTTVINDNGGSVQIGGYSSSSVPNFYLSGYRPSTWSANALYFGDEINSARYFMNTRGTNENNNADWRFYYYNTGSGSNSWQTILDVLPTSLNAQTYAEELHDGALTLNSDGSATFAGKVSGVTPTASANLATKAYVDTAVAGAGGSGAPTNFQVFTSSGTWTKPGSGSMAYVQCWGGGGGGGWGYYSGGSCGTGGGGGGGGGYAYAWFPLSSLSSSVTVSIGSGGSSNSGTGGNTTFGSQLTASGGGGGTAAVSYGNITTGGDGGSGSGTGVAVLSGAPGFSGGTGYLGSIGGAGGGSGQSGTGGGAGNGHVGNVPGGGGGGGACNSNGGAGAAGECVVTVY